MYMQFLKATPDSASSLIDQINAYQENYFDVAHLISEAEAKSEALELVERMKDSLEEV